MDFKLGELDDIGSTGHSCGYRIYIALAAIKAQMHASSQMNVIVKKVQMIQRACVSTKNWTSQIPPK